jgi:hypothetical protein
MGRFAPEAAVTGTVKSIQHVSQAISSNNSYTPSISAVDTNKSIINSTGGFANFRGAQGGDVIDRSGSASSPARVSFNSTTSLSIVVPNLDFFGSNFGSTGNTWAGTVVEYT